VGVEVFLDPRETMIHRKIQEYYTSSRKARTNAYAAADNFSASGIPHSAIQIADNTEV
jgi:hypothetical protein